MLMPVWAAISLTVVASPSVPPVFRIASIARSSLAWPDGSVTTFSSSSISETGARTLSLGIDGSNNLTSVTDVDGTARSYSYDGQHHLTNAQWSPTNATYTYDAASAVLPAKQSVWNWKQKLGPTRSRGC